MSKILNDIAYFPIQKQMSLTNEEKSYIKWRENVACEVINLIKMKKCW